jgi:transcriptional regulator with XRE-family HTH domain
MITHSNKTLRTFGNSLRLVRKSQGLSQEKLAQACGLDRTYLSGLERGVRNPSLLVIVKISATLNTTLADLFLAIDTEA